MIDEAFETELEARLRVALDEMIPKLVASEIAIGDESVEATAAVLVARQATPIRGSRRMVVAALAVAAMLLGLIVIANRDTGEVAPADAGPPKWYDLIAPSLPERFPYLALTFATDVQLWFVAINPIEGKTLEIQLSSGGYSVSPATTVDATGVWAETAQGWSVGTPAGLFISVSCNIGVGGRDYIGPENHCEKSAGAGVFTKDDIRAVANALATSLTLSIFEQDVGPPTGDAIDTAQATALIAADGSGQQIAATDLGGGADHIYNVGAGLGTGSSSDTLPPLDAIPPRADTSVRILHGVYPPPPVTGEPAVALYDDVAVVSMIGSGGVVIRIGTTDSSPESVTRLGQLAQDLMALDPTVAEAESTPTTNTILEVTTTSLLVGFDAQTTSSVDACDPASPSPIALVVNASHINGTAAWWTQSLAADVSSVGFAEPMNAIAQEPNSRVLALDGYGCAAALVAGFTNAATVEPATIDSLQALVAEPLPAGTSIVVVVGDDIMSKFTTGVTTTISS
jgi:hypothetical protein